MWVLQQARRKYCWQLLCQKSGVHDLQSNMPRYISHSPARELGGCQSNGGAEGTCCNPTQVFSVISQWRSPCLLACNAGVPSPLPRSTPEESCSLGGRIASA